jgi:O-antigen/teichoic acid export membrane protein
MAEINLRKNIFLSGSFRIAIMMLSFLAGWISTRYLGAELKGKYSYLVTLGGFIWTIFDLGLYRSYPYLIRKSPDKINNLYSWALLTFLLETIVLSALGLGFMSFWSHIFNYTFTVLYMALFVGFITLTKLFMQLLSLYMGLDKILDHSLALFFNSALCFLMFGIGYFALKHWDRLAYVLISTVSALLLGSGYLILRHNWGGLLRLINLRYIGAAYKFGIRVFLSSLFVMLLIRSDIVLIKHFLGYKDVGVYSIAAHIVDVLQMVSNLVGGLLFVKLSDTKDDITSWILMKKMLMLFSFFLTAANLLFIIIGKFVLRELFGLQFVPSYSAYLWLIPASYGLSFGSLFNNYLNARGFPIISIILPAAALVLNVGLNLLIIPAWGIIGASISTSIAYLLWFFLILFYEQGVTKGRMFKHLNPSRQDWKDLFLSMFDMLNTALRRIKGKT